MSKIYIQSKREDSNITKKTRKGFEKNGRLVTSRRYNRLLLLPSGPGRVQQELAV